MAADIGSFTGLSGFLLMVPPNQKPNTLYSAFIGGGAVCNGKVVSGTRPHKRPQPAQECGAVLTAAAPAASRLRRTLAFLSALPFSFGPTEACEDFQTFVPPTLGFMSNKKKTAKVKSSQSTSNRCGAAFLCRLFFRLRLPFGSRGPLSPPPHSDVGHFTFISSETPIVLNVIWKKEVKEAALKKNETKKYRLMPIRRKEGGGGVLIGGRALEDRC